MIILRSKKGTYINDVSFPNCECIRWARIFDNRVTAHHPNCNKLEEELYKNGFIKVFPKGSLFICRVRSSTSMKIMNAFRAFSYDDIIPSEIFVKCNTIEQLRDSIIDAVNNKKEFVNIVAKPLIIDRLLFIRYYECGEFLFHEEYSYIEDEYETRKIYN